MKKLFLVIIASFLVCASAYRWGGVELEMAKKVMMEQVYSGISKLFFPHVYLYNASAESLVYRDLEQMIVPMVSSYRITSGYQKLGQEDTWIEMPNEPFIEYENTDDIYERIEIPSQKQQIINRTKLQDFDYLRQTFYQVDNTTTVDSTILDVNKFLAEDMVINENGDGPKILIYHTHSQEAYADSIPGDASTSVVALGNYLDQLLTEQYGLKVLHHTGQYDVINRDGAYAQALPSLEKILNDNPSIEVVIDIHRDGVPETTHLVTEINGKPTAQIMFFNGLSHTTALGNLEYLANPYISQNLAFSFQMQLATSEYYPNLARRIYLKGYRYNMHLLPKSLLVEVGAQTNTFQEAKNAMEPLADILAKVLKGM